MNDDQVDDLNASSFWRDRNEKESQEKKHNSKLQMRATLKWWAEVSKWEEFVNSYNARFVDLVFNATSMNSATRVAPGKYSIHCDEHGAAEFQVSLPRLPEWDIKTSFDLYETHFLNKLDNK
jgi:hypothetical protein